MRIFYQWYAHLNEYEVTLNPGGLHSVTQIKRRHGDAAVLVPIASGTRVFRMVVDKALCESGMPRMITVSNLIALVQPTATKGIDHA